MCYAYEVFEGYLGILFVCVCATEKAKGILTLHD